MIRFAQVGIGNIGKKRLKTFKKKIITVDKKSKVANFKFLKDVPLENYDAVIISTPEKYKKKLIDYCICNKKHILVEKPLLLKNEKQLKILENKANKNNIFMTVGYNHRYEDSINYIKNFHKKKILGKFYHGKICYLNGTAKNVKKTWRDTQQGVIKDLLPHVLDLIIYIFGKKKIKHCNVKKLTFENKSSDYCIANFFYGSYFFQSEVSYCNWKNHFSIKFIYEKGAIILNSLAKWEIPVLEIQYRNYPSGKPDIKIIKFKNKDLSLAKEIDQFKKDILIKKKTNLIRDTIIQRLLTNI